jgi:hypothetical protein
MAGLVNGLSSAALSRGNKISATPHHRGDPRHKPQTSLNRPGMSGDSICWEGWSHAREYVEEVSAGVA